MLFDHFTTTSTTITIITGHALTIVDHRYCNDYNIVVSSGAMPKLCPAMGNALLQIAARFTCRLELLTWQRFATAISTCLSAKWCEGSLSLSISLSLPLFMGIWVVGWGLVSHGCALGLPMFPEHVSLTFCK